MAEYKIGTFAKNLGVTTSLLKHYEKYHLITSNKNEINGYRYYGFTQTPTILRIKQLQKLGFTLREIATMLKSCTTEEMSIKIQEKIEDIHTELFEKQLLLKEAEHIQKHLHQINQDQFEGNWTIEETPAMYFLPHSKQLDFVELDETKSEQLKSWIDHFPLTKQATLVSNHTDEYQYGLAIEQQIAHRLNLPMQSSVPIVIEGGKSLIYPVICSSFDEHGKEFVRRLLQKPIALLSRMGIQAKEHAHIETILEITHNQKRVIYYQIYIPLYIINPK